MSYSPEQLPKSTEISPAKARLRTLEAESKYLFHGSGSKIDTLEPRQAYNDPRNPDEEKIADDKPAVFASPIADIAIFMAVINGNNAPAGARSGVSFHSGGSYEFRVTTKTMDQIGDDAAGYVYVFDRGEFIPRSPEEEEWLSYKTVVPVEVVKVSKKDLPEKIAVKDF